MLRGMPHTQCVAPLRNDTIMTIDEIDWGTIELPPHLVDLLATLPATMDRQHGASVVSQHMFPVSSRTLKSWPLPWRCPNGRAIAPTETYLKYACRKSRQAHATTNRWRHLNQHTASA